MSRDHVIVSGFQRPHPGDDIVFGNHFGSAAAPERVAEGFIAEQRRKGGRQGFRVPFGYQKTGFQVVDNFWNAAVPGSYHRDAPGRGLFRDHKPGLPVTAGGDNARRKKDVHSVHEV